MAAFITFQPSDFFNVINYTGTSASHAVTGVGFQPAFTWNKSTSNVLYHYAFDTARGATEGIFPNGTDTEAISAEYLKSWESDGFTLGSNTSLNGTGKDFISWNWKGGTTSGIATNGSTTITPTGYSFNQTSGFSTIAYTGNATSGAKLAHGLGKTPTMIFLKNLGTANDWVCYQKSVKATDPEDWVMRTNNTSATVDDAAMWNDTQPDDVNITLGNSANTNGSANNYIAYCFAPIQGHSIFGRYYGNATDNGPFIQTNFRPKFVILKRLDGTTSWKIFANPNYTINTGADADAMDVNTGAARASFGKIDFVSNGFKIRDSDSIFNTNGSQNVYWAFAEFPFVSSNSKAGTAR